MLRDLEVSPIGIGTMGFSHGYGEVPGEEYTIEAIREAYEFGATFIDTAEVYGREMFYPGHNEEMVGKAIEPFRDEVVLATKFFLEREEYGEEVTIYDAIRKHLDGSLEKLRTDYVDLYYWHRVNEEIPVEDVAEVMGQLIEEGVIKGWGMSQVSVEYLDRAHQVTPVSAVQSVYSMVERGAEEDVIPYCLENNIGFVPFSPIASGLLSGKVTKETKFEGDDVRKFVPQLSDKNIDANQPIIDLIAKYADDKGATNAQISMAWMLHKYPNVVPITGSKNKGRIIENLGAWNVELTDEEFEKLESELEKLPVHGHRGHVETQQRGWAEKQKAEGKE